MPHQKMCFHGMSKARGCGHLSLGEFGHLFEGLPPWPEDCGINEQCEVEQLMARIGGPGGLMHDADNSSPDSELPAGYTFFGQFVDHDITLDTRSQLHGSPTDEANQPEQLANLRSASLDLDCVYGFGPEANPHLYDRTQAGRLLISDCKQDLARNADGTALIGDPRNDENLFVSQMQLMWIKFHNKRLIGRGFEEAQAEVRNHYQWVVLHDYLERICNKPVYEHALGEIKKAAKKKAKHLTATIVDPHGRIRMPLEFSVAAYRFGHTTVRSVYPANERHPVVDLFDERFGTEGFSAIPSNLTVDWRYLLEVDECIEPVKAKAFDHLFPDELIRMPDPIVGRFSAENDRSLAFRNLLRGHALGLPSGQRLAAALDEAGYPIPNAGLDFSEVPGWKCLDKAWQKKLSEHTPLFFYLMVESGQREAGARLGPTASAILMEVFAAMLLHCDNSIVTTGWKPQDTCINGGKHLGLRDIARYVA